mgnify:CR=1 FL=1
MEQQDAGRTAFRAIYQEMVETDTSAGTGSCTKMVKLIEGRLKAAGFVGDDVQLVIPDGKPDDGNVVARIRAPGATKKGVLLLAHIDVVDAHREDWERDPFKLVEENGFFYGRGSSDDKAMAAVFLDLMIRLKQEKAFKPKRDLIMALTCGEETSNRVNGVDYIVQNKRQLIDAAFAINEGAGGLMSDDGKPLVLQVQAGEKIHQVYQMEVTNQGGHSSRPTPDNAIYRLMGAMDKVSKLSFPIQITPVVREYFRVSGPLIGGETGAAMTAIRAAFGNGVLTEDGALNRAAMRALAFESQDARKRLEGILHPMIRQESERQCLAASAPYVILAVPLLIESGTYRERVQRLCVVDCPEALQIARVMGRSGLEERQVRAIMSAQATRADRLAAADDVVDNAGSLDDLQARVTTLHGEYIQCAARHRVL